MLCQQGSPRAGFLDLGWMKSSVANPTEHGQVSECVDHNTKTIATGPSQYLIVDILNDVMRFGIEYIASKGLQGLNFELKEKRNLCCGHRSEQGQVSDCVDHFIQTIAAGPSQCLIMNILNDVMVFGLKCIASKGLHGLNFEIKEKRNLSCSHK